MNAQKLLELKLILDNHAKICYVVGKKEGLAGIKEESPAELKEIPLELLEDMLSEITAEPAEEMGFCGPAIKIKKIKK